MCIIQTRQQKNGNWWCNGTIVGYDYSYEGQTIEEAQSQMRALLEYRGINSAEWQEEQHYQENRDMPEYLLKTQTTRLQLPKVDEWDEAEELAAAYANTQIPEHWFSEFMHYLRNNYSITKK